MKKLLFLTCLGIATKSNLNAQTIAAARAQGVGANVSVRGIVLNGSELGIIRYLQDNTGGIAAYGSAVTSLNKGDSVLISGPLTEFYNLYEITPPTVQFISANATLPTPQVITPSQFSEVHEGKLIKILNCTFSATGNFSSTATNYTVTANSQTFAVRSNTLLAGTPIPTGTVNIIGIGSQFCGPQSSSGCTTGYQLLPRTTADFAVPTTTGLDKLTHNALVSVYPNPASGTISYRLSGNEQPLSIVITDVVGKVIYSTNESRSTLDISELSKGFFNLFITTQNNNYNTKFIVE